MLNTFYSYIFKKRITVFVLAGLLFILLLISASGIIFSENILSIIPDDSTSLSRYKELLDNFDPLNRMYITFEFTENFNEQELTECADAFYNKMLESAHFSSIMYKWNYDDLTAAIDRMSEYLPALYTAKDIETINNNFQYDSLLLHFAEWKRLLTESMDPFLSKQFVSDPLGLKEILMNKIVSVNSMQNSITIHNGRFFTNDKQKLIIIAVPVVSSTDSGNSEILINFIEETKKTLSADYPFLRISYLSGHRFSLENANRMKGDIQITLTISIAAIVLLSFLIYIRPSLILFTLLPAIFGSVFSLGILRWIFPDISAIIIGCGAMFIGISVDYGIHILFHIDRIKEITNFRDKIKLILKKVTRPLLLSAGTTLLAFLTLRLSILPGYQQLGLFVFFGIIGALLFVLIILPLIIPKPGVKTKKHPHIPIGQICNNFFVLTSKYKILFILLIIIITLGMIPGFVNIQLEGDISKLNVSTDEIKTDMENVLESLGNSANYILIAARGKDLESALQQSEKLNVYLDKLQETLVIDTYNSIVDIIPSIEQQIESINSWEQFIDSGALEQLNENLYIISNRLDIKYDFLKDATEPLTMYPDYITRNSYSNTIINTIISNQIGVSEKSSMILTPVSLADNKYFDFLKDYLNITGLDLIIYSGKSFASEILEVIFSEMLKIILIAALFVIALLFIIKRNIIKVLKMLTPLCLSLFWTFSIMGWSGIQINIVNCLVAVFIFGLVIDYCIFLVFASEGSSDKKHILNTSSAVSISAITTIFGLGALVFARHPALHSIGFTALIAISSGLITVLILIPLFFHKKQDSPLRKQ